MPAAWKNSAISLDSGAPPDTAKRSRPPRAARIFEKTSLSASRCWKASADGTGWRACTSFETFLPTPTAQKKIFFLSPFSAFGPGENPRVHLLEYPRHAADEVGLDLGEVLPEPVDVLGERRGEAPIDPREGLEPAEGVRQRQEEEMDVAFLYPQRLLRGLEHEHVVAVGLDHALGRARRARGVHDRRDVVGLSLGDPARQLALERVGAVAAELAQRLPGEHPAAPCPDSPPSPRPARGRPSCPSPRPPWRAGRRPRR